MGNRGATGRRRAGSLVAAAIALGLLLSLVFTGIAAAQTAPNELEIEVLSNRADLVSGDDALVEIVRPQASNPDSVRVELNGEDVSELFAVRDDGRFIGLLEDLNQGANQLRAAVHQYTSELEITNHPVGGPIFSGPHLQPWLCTTQTAGNGLGPAVDDECNAPTRVDFFYQPSGGGSLQPYDPENPPANVGTTTTDEGETVPFIVRRERGTMNRGIYDVAVLYDPEQPWEPWAPQSGWNGKITWPYGAAAGTVHSQGSTVNVLNVSQLGRGFMVATHSLNQHNSNLNIVVSAESMMMLKEHIIDSYGPVRYVIGQGSSGAAIQQQMIANTYPGLLDGIMPSASFPDTFTTGTEVQNCIVMNSYFAQNGALWPIAARTHATGHLSTLVCTLWQVTFSGPTTPTSGCGLPAGTSPNPNTMYHPVNNPIGVRCTAQDYMVNVFGRRDADGFAKKPGTNIGVQYALRALLDGQVTAEQFVHLNENLGSLNIDGQRVAGTRFPSDEGATHIAYRTGRVNDGANMDRVAIFDLRSSENSGIHTNFHTWQVKERLKKANGHADNHVVYFAPGGLPAVASNEAFNLMDQWLEAVEADDSAKSLEEKIVDNKPAAAEDACWIGGVKHTDQEFCLQQAPFFAAPNIAAGDELDNQSIECQLKPLEESDYPAGTFTPAQWARMGATFPDGACDWTKPPRDSEPTIPWLTFAGGPGGEPLGDPPVSRQGCVGSSQGGGKAAPGTCPGRPAR